MVEQRQRSGCGVMVDAPDLESGEKNFRESSSLSIRIKN
jgi:hypothetical protein